MKSILFTTVLLLTVFVKSTFAQEDKAIQRKGFVFGTSLGSGYTILNFPDNDQSGLGFALDVKLGYMVTQDLAILLATNVSVYDYSGFGRDRKRDFGILAPSFQYWLNDKVWLLAGVGIGGDNPVFWDIDLENMDPEPLETKYYTGIGFVSAIGYELYQQKNMALDLKIKTSYRDVTMKEGRTNGLSIALLFGINFY